MISKWDVTYFQCKTNLNWSMAVTETDRIALVLSSLIFLCCSAHNTTPLKWEHHLLCDLSHRDTCHQRRGV